jgi:DNA-binding CsgD family transcriptional regulator/PAS domain-containing protein
MSDLREQLVNEPAHLSHVIGNIYDAAISEDNWPEALASIAGFVSGSFVNVFWQDATRRAAQAFHTWGIEKPFLDAYFATYIRINPLFPSMLFFEEERIITEADVMPLDQFFATRFYKEWVAPQGLKDSMASVLEKSATSLTGIAVGRRKTELPLPDAMGRLGLIVPHVRRAVIIGKLVEHHKLEGAALADTLDGLATAMLLVDAGGRIVHANASALALVAEGVVVQQREGRLVTADAAADATLRDVFARAERGDVEVGTRGIAVPLVGRNGRRFISHVLPLTAGARRRAGMAYAAVAAVFLRIATPDQPHPVQAIAAAFGLTSGEMRVLMIIIEFGGVPEVAQALGISQTTVKTHLQHMFAKTGTSRQADLVKLAMRYLSPFA